MGGCFHFFNFLFIYKTDSLIPENSTIVVKESQLERIPTKKLKLPIVKPNLADNLSYESIQV